MRFEVINHAVRMDCGDENFFTTLFQSVYMGEQQSTLFCVLNEKASECAQYSCAFGCVYAACKFFYRPHIELTAVWFVKVVFRAVFLREYM